MKKRDKLRHLQIQIRKRIIGIRSVTADPNVLRPRIRTRSITSPGTVTPVEVVAEPSLLMMGNVLEFRHDSLRAREGERSRCNTRYDSRGGQRKGKTKGWTGVES